MSDMRDYQDRLNEYNEISQRMRKSVDEKVLEEMVRVGNEYFMNTLIRMDAQRTEARWRSEMLELKECNKDCFCKDCDDKECLCAGKPEADCPRYHCLYQPSSKEHLDCENCLWLKGWYEEMKKGGVKNE